MPFTGSFTKTDQSATAFNSFKITDTSSYADEPKETFSDRRIWLVNVDGTYVSPDDVTEYWPFGFDDYPGDEITIDALTYDVSLSIYVQWVSDDPQAGSTYNATEVSDFVDYAENFMYFKIQQMAINRNLESNKNFRTTLDLFRTLIDSSTTSIVYEDQYASQECIDDIEVIENNVNMFY